MNKELVSLEAKLNEISSFYKPKLLTELEQKRSGPNWSLLCRIPEILKISFKILDIAKASSKEEAPAQIEPAPQPGEDPFKAFPLSDLNILVAEALGWKRWFISAKEAFQWGEWEGTYYSPRRLNDWATDLNEAYNLEATIPPEDEDTYLRILLRRVNSQLEYTKPGGISQRFWLTHADAETRCRAYLEYIQSPKAISLQEELERR